MLTPIHRALGRVPSPITWDLMEEAVREQVQERAELDWKQTVYDQRDPKWQDEAAKDIGAMANSGGGWIVFGIAEDRQTSAAAEITGVAWGQGDEQRLLRVAYSRIGPPVLGLEFHLAEDPPADAPGDVVLMRVPDSSERPHLARKDGDAFVAPVRNGHLTAFMSDREIERAFRDRFNLRGQVEASLRDLYEETAEHLACDTAVGIVLVAMPIELRNSPVKVADHALSDVFALGNLGDFYAQPGRVSGSLWSAGEIRRGYRRWTRRSREQDRPAFRCIHENGTVQAGFRLGGLWRGQEAASYYPVGMPNHCMAEHVEHALVESMELLQRWAARLEVPGGYRVRVGLVGKPGEPIYIRMTRNNTNWLLDLDHSEPIYRFHPVTLELNPLSPVEHLVPIVGEIALDLINQGGVQYLSALRNPGEIG